VARRKIVNVNVAVVGAHGKIALRLTRLLAADGDQVVGLFRNPEHAGDVREAGASPVVCDLEQATVQEIATAIAGTDALVFAAGAGPGSGAARKVTMDRDGAIKLLHAATTAAVPRYLMISGSGVEDPPADDDVFSVYIRAKAEADAAVTASDRQWTILRPGGLTDDPGTGQVRIGTAPFRGPVTRDDVASVLAALLKDSRSAGRILYLSSGAQSIDEALDGALGSPG
jgi:nucleoside-diphosphate-sugar epimerase